MRSTHIMLDRYLSSRTWEGKKEHRKKFRKAKVTDLTCRNHGSCEYCTGNRTYFDKKARLAVILQLDDITYTEPDEYEGFEIDKYWKQYWEKWRMEHEDRDI